MQTDIQKVENQVIRQAGKVDFKPGIKMGAMEKAGRMYSGQKTRKSEKRSLKI